MRRSQSSKQAPTTQASLTRKLANATPEERRRVVETIETSGTDAQKAKLKEVPNKYKE